MSWPYAAGAYAAYYGAPAAPPPPPPPTPKTWKEHKTPEGKPYWSDGATSVWEEPAAYKEAREKAAALIEANKRSKEEPPAVKEPEPEPNIKPLPVLDPKQKVEAFKQLLSDSDIKSTASFPEVAAKLGQHPTYTALPKGERKQALAEYKTKRAKVEKETERKRSREARAGFLRLLAEAEEISVDTNWSKADELLAATCDERYQAVSTSTERKGLFDEFVSALREKDASEKRQTTEKAREAFRKALVQLAREHPAASHEDDDAALLIGVFGRTRFSDVESAMQKKNPNLLLSLPVWKSTSAASMAWRSTRRFSTFWCFYGLRRSPDDRRREYQRFVDDCHETVRRRDDTKRRAFVDAALAAILRGLLPRELPFAELDTVLSARQRGGAKAVAQMSAAFAAEEGQLPSDDDDEEDNDTEVVVARVKEAMADLAACQSRLGGDCCVRAFGKAKDLAYRSFKIDRRQCRDLTRRCDADLKSFGAWLTALKKIDRRSPPRDADVRHERRMENWSLGEACELRRPQLARVFVDLRDEAAQEARDAARRRERRERRFRELLEDYLRWPDDKNATYEDLEPSLARHATYEDLEPSLARHSAYDGVPRGRRRELFEEVLRGLKERASTAPERWTSAVSDNDRWSPGVAEGPEAPPPKKARGDA